VQIILTEKDNHRRVYYCSSEAMVKMRTLAGKEAVLAKIDFKSAQADKGLPIFGFGFRDKRGQAILWRVLPSTSPSERGAGLSQILAPNDLYLEYRDSGTTVGEGTSVKIGDKVFEAEPWDEISAPPYFYGFHGGFTVGGHIGALSSGTENWRVVSQPKELKKDAEWVLMEEHGRLRNLKIVSQNRDELTISEINPQVAGSSLINLIVLPTPQGFALHSMQISNRSQLMEINFSPELPFQSATSFESSFTISEGKNKNIAGRTVTAEPQTDKGVALKWQIRTPAWEKSRVMETSIKMDARGYSIETVQAAKLR
jgi:hypothetical protein